MSRFYDAMIRGRRQTTLANPDRIDFTVLFSHGFLLIKLIIELPAIAFEHTLNYKSDYYFQRSKHYTLSPTTFPLRFSTRFYYSRRFINTMVYTLTKGGKNF